MAIIWQGKIIEKTRLHRVYTWNALAKAMGKKQQEKKKRERERESTSKQE